MNISLITPAGKGARSGNRTTAVRWQRLLRALGHRVRLSVTYDGVDAELMIAVHAFRSADAIRRFRSEHPTRPLVVALAGTDVYRFQHSDPEITLRSMEAADALVGLHDFLYRDIPHRFASKLHIIHQSASPLPRLRRPSSRHFDICVVANMRDEKDPLRTAEAASFLPATSRVRVLHFGAPLDPTVAAAAEREMAVNPRYRWYGAVPGAEIRRAYGHCHLLVLSSVMEGGANVISEAIVAGLPVIASDISGSRGLLGDDYPGYFPIGDTQALADLLHRAETDPVFLATLESHCRARAHLFRPERERENWAELLKSLENCRPTRRA